MPQTIKSSHQAHVGHNEDHSGVDSDSESGADDEGESDNTAAKHKDASAAIIDKQFRSGPVGEAIASNKQLAWVELNIGSGSYLTYKMPYFAADHEGCVTELECEIKNCEISNGSAVSLRGEQK